MANTAAAVTHYRLSAPLVSVQPSETAILAVTIANTSIYSSPVCSYESFAASSVPAGLVLDRNDQLLFARYLASKICKGVRTRIASRIVRANTRFAQPYIFLTPSFLFSFHVISNYSTGLSILTFDTGTVVIESTRASFCVNCLSIVRHWHVSVTFTDHATTWSCFGIHSAINHSLDPTAKKRYSFQQLLATSSYFSTKCPGRS